MAENKNKPEDKPKTKRARTADPMTIATKALKSYRKATAAEAACKAAVEKLGTGCCVCARR